MNQTGRRSEDSGIENHGIHKASRVNWNLSPAELIEQTISKGQGSLADSGGLVVSTGEFTGRSPKDKFVVRDDTTAKKVWWGSVNQEFEPAAFDRLEKKITAYFEGKELWVRDSYAGANPKHRIAVRVVNENPWQNLFVNNLFIRPEPDELTKFKPDWTILCAPGFLANPAEDGTRQHNFTIVNFTKRMILIGGSAYTGEIKKGIFTVMNYLLPEAGVLSMHCSANIGKSGDTAVFFGLSGTGKTTLSADPLRNLIGDDEHGWTETGVFNMEGGCYAKCINLTEEKEPQIWKAIRFGTLVENTLYYPGTRTVNYDDESVTPNSRAAYPIDYIEGAVEPSVGGIPKNIFFLTCDAFGVFPPISRLTAGQAMYQFISGYTAKVAGTEAGVTEPQTTFSACFGAPFLPLHPTRYAELLGKLINKHKVNVWMINTGWTGGSYGTGSRMKLSHTRRMITAALKGELDGAAFNPDPVFGLNIPASVPEVPSEILISRNTWADKAAYDRKANDLAGQFNANFDKYKEFANEEILKAAPKVHA